MATVAQVPLVIFIDDDESVCEAMAGFLKAFGFGVETFLGLEAGRQLKLQGRWLGDGGTFCGTLRTSVGI